MDAVLSYVEDYFVHAADAGTGRMRTVLVLLFESLAAAPELRPIVAGMSAASRSHLSERIAHGIADGSIRPDLDPDMQAMLIAGLLRNVVHEWVLDPTAIDLAAVAVDLQDRVYTSTPATGTACWCTTATAASRSPGATACSATRMASP